MVLSSCLFFILFGTIKNENYFFNVMKIFLILIVFFSTGTIHSQSNLPKQITDVIPKNLTLVSGNSYSKRNFLKTGILTLNIKNEYRCGKNSDEFGYINIHYSFYDPKREDIIKLLKDQKAYERNLRELQEKSEYSWKEKSDTFSTKSKLQEISYNNGKGYYYLTTIQCKSEKNKKVDVVTINTLRGDDEKFIEISINAAVSLSKANEVINELYLRLIKLNLFRE